MPYLHRITLNARSHQLTYRQLLVLKTRSDTLNQAHEGFYSSSIAFQAPFIHSDGLPPFHPRIIYLTELDLAGAIDDLESPS